MTHTQTQTQIEALAKAYADSFELRPSEYNRWLNYSERAERVLEWLLKDHLVVEKSKVISLYNCYNQHIQTSSKNGLHDALVIAKGSIATMHDIFGKETFNPTEK